MRLIDADRLEDVIEDECFNYVSDNDFNVGIQNGLLLARDFVQEAPTIDAVQVVRCKDCHFCGEIDENGWHCCENLGVGMPKNGFCSDAERREDVKVN